MTALRTLPGLTATCPDCEDGTAWKSRRGGNDPDVWATACERCDVSGEVPVWCSGCRNQASEMVNELPWCSGCATDQRENA